MRIAPEQKTIEALESDGAADPEDVRTEVRLDLMSRLMQTPPNDAPTFRRFTGKRPRSGLPAESQS